MPPSLIRAPPDYPTAPTPTYLPPGTDPNENATASNGGACAGQTIPAGSTRRDGRQFASRETHLLELEGDHSGRARIKRASAGSCNSLSQTYGITTGDLQTITVPLFLQWNPNIIGLCDSLATDQYICNGPPGGGYTLPPPINGTNTNADGQQRGGQGGSSNPNGPNGPNGPSVNSTTSAPTQAGIVDSCNAFAYARADDTCYQMAQRFYISLAQLTAWNPVLGYPDGHNCTTQFWAGYDYCVGVSGPSTTTSVKPPPTSTITLSPSYPTQSGIIASCNKYKEAVSGDYCVKFAQDNGISTDQLYAWNKALGDGGAACNTQFQAGYDYCVSDCSSRILFMF
ncbi:MAG: hypothetical protein Q9201_001148 [Fulgogasparrea decipioides]